MTQENFKQALEELNNSFFEAINCIKRDEDIKIQTDVFNNRLSLKLIVADGIRENIVEMFFFGEESNFKSGVYSNIIENKDASKCIKIYKSLFALSEKVLKKERKIKSLLKELQSIRAKREESVLVEKQEQKENLIKELRNDYQEVTADEVLELIKSSGKFKVVQLQESESGYEKYVFNIEVYINNNNRREFEVNGFKTTLRGIKDTILNKCDALFVKRQQG